MRKPPSRPSSSSACGGARKSVRLASSSSSPGLGDFVTSIVLYTPDNRPIAIEIMSSLRVSELGVAAGFGVILMVLSAVVLGVGARR